MKPKSRILSLLLAICLVVGLMPTTAFAAEGDKTIMLGTSGISGYDSTKGYDYIYYGNWSALDNYTTSGPIKWRVLDDQTNTGGTGLFLLTDTLLGSGTYGGVYFDKSSRNSNAWQGSDAQTWCQDFCSSNFSTGEQSAVLATTKSDEAFTSTYSLPFAASENILNEDKVFFLSAQEAENDEYGFTNDAARIADYGVSAGVWWLRSPSANYTNLAGVVYRNGYGSNYYVNYDYAVRPAFNLDLNSVLFTSAAVGGKIPAASSGGNQGGEAADAIFEIGDYDGSEWKLTLLDNSRNFAVTEEAASGKPGDTITLNYTGATTGTNEYISVIIADSSGAQYYGRVAQPTATDGKVEITIPSGLADGTYTLYVFSEQYNGGEQDDTKLTDYASAFETVALTVSSDTTASPAALDFGSKTVGYTEAPAAQTVTLTNTGNQNVTVTLPASANYTITAGEGFANSTATLAPNGTAAFTVQPNTGLTAGDYDETLTVSGGSDVSASIELSFEVLETYTLTVDLNGGSGGTTCGEYAEGAVVNIDAGSRSNYRFAGWTSTNGGAFADASSASTTFTMPAANTTITAAWSYIGGGGSTTDYYRLTFETNGGSEISSIRRAEYTTIDLTDYTPTREGYEFTGWYADENLTEKITSIRLTRNTTVYAGWEEIKENPSTGFENPFTDVSESDWFFNDVKFVYQNGLMNGTSATTFSPEGTTSRGMIVTILWRMAGSPDMEDKIWGYPFADVDATAYYGTAVYWARLNGIAGGYDDATFGPNDPITREQMAAILYRYAQYKGYDVSAKADLNKFTDADEISNYALEALQWANAEGLINGKGDGVLDPKGQATRAEAAVILTRFNEVVAE